MKEMKRFNDFKADILRRADNAFACTSEYTRAIKSENFKDLMQVIKDNFDWCCVQNVIDEKLILEYKEQFNSNEIYFNESRNSGYLLVTGHVDRICGNCKAVIMGNAYVYNIFDNAYISMICGNAKIENICGNAKIINIYDNSQILYVAGDAEIMLFYGKAKIINLFGNSKIKKVF